MANESTPSAKFLTNPVHGGKETCHKCGGFIVDDGDQIGYRHYQHGKDYPNTWFHADCYNPYAHYYGLDKPLD